MTDKCNEVRDALAVQGKVPAGVNDERLREHLESCVRCAAFLKMTCSTEATSAARSRASSTFEIYGSDFLQRPQQLHRLSRATGKRPVISRCSQNM